MLLKIDRLNFYNEPEEHKKKSFLNAFSHVYQAEKFEENRIKYIQYFYDNHYYNFHFLGSALLQYIKARSYREKILSDLQLDPTSPSIKIVGDSLLGAEQFDFVRQYLFDIFDNHPNHHVFYQNIGNINAIINDWVAHDPKKQHRVIAHALFVDVPSAMKKWECHYGNIQNILVVPAKAYCDNGIEISDNLIPQYNQDAGESIAICIEGDVASFISVTNMLRLNVSVILIEKLREVTHQKYKDSRPEFLFFSTSEFLNILKKSLADIHNDAEATAKLIESTCNSYLYNPAIHGPYSFEKHQHFHVLSDPFDDETYVENITLFTRALDLLVQNQIGLKLKKLVNVMDYNEECALEKQVLMASEATFSAMLQHAAALPPADVLSQDTALITHKTSQILIEKTTHALIKNFERVARIYALRLSLEEITHQCVSIVNFFYELKEHVYQNDYLSDLLNTRIKWSLNYQGDVERFKDKLISITSMIGRISPESCPGVLWGGIEGMIAASKMGRPTHKILLVKFINSVFYNELKDAFFPNLVNNPRDYAVACLYWAVISSIYVSNVKNDINLYKIDNTVHSGSIFWNYELPIIRKLGLTIRMNTLKPMVFWHLDQLKSIPSSSPMMDVQIESLLSNPHNWIKTRLESKLKITSGSEPKVSISYTKLLSFFKHWQQHSVCAKRSSVDIPLSLSSNAALS